MQDEIQIGAGKLYGPGTIFAVPHRNGIVPGVVSHTDSKNILLTWFLRTVLSSETDLDLESLPKGPDSYLRIKHSDMFLRKHRWRTIGQVPRFAQDDWPLPLFFRRDTLEPSNLFLSEYSRSLSFVREVQASSSDIDDGRYVKDSTLGAALVEKRLNKHLT